MLRKRVWDIMREDFASVREDATLSEAITALREIRSRQADTSFVLVFSKNDKFMGVLSMWNLIQGIGPCLLKGSVLEGNEVDLLEMTWPGTELSFDFSVVSVAGRYLAFPKRIFTDRLAPSSGTNLYPRYDRGGFPAIFEGGNFSAYSRKKLMDLFRMLKEDGDPSGSFGSVVHDIARLAAFEPGIVYRVVSRSKGGIEILEE